MLRGAGPVPLLSAAFRGCCALSTKPDVCFYELLGVPKGAETTQIKEAFRQKAKLLHPDAQSQHGRVDHAAFVRLLTAYQVLSNTRSRELYDVSISTRGSSLLRKAAAAGVHGGVVDEEPEIDLSWGLGALFKPASEAGADAQHTMLDKLRGKLQSDLHVALRHAYLGPKLHLEDAHQLPDCFEAEERSTPETAEVLELVSGRQLLGVVRERRAAQLGGGDSGPWHSLAGAGRGTEGGLLGGRQEAAQVDAASSAWPPGGVAAEACSRSAPGQEGSVSTAAGPDPPPAGGVAASFSGPGDHAGGTAALGPAGVETAAGGFDPGIRQLEGFDPGEGGSQEEPEVLQLIMGEQLVARAVRHPQRASRAGPVPAGTAAWRHTAHSVHSGSGSRPPGKAAGAVSEEGAANPRFSLGSSGDAPLQPQARAAAAQHGADTAGAGCDAVPPLLVVSFYRGGRLLGQLQAEHEAATSNSPSAARFLDPHGIHTHTVLRSSSPLVRHLNIVAEPSTGIAPARRSRATVFRARRAWLPPSALWLFRPRSFNHDIGGWYVEWAGHESSSHPAWLDPAVCVLTAGFDTLDHERARQQPQGLFGRLRAGDETAGGAMSWFRAMLRFHGVRK